MKVVLSGLPGAGKGTLGVRLAESLGVPHVSVGDEVRWLVAGESELGARLRAWFGQTGGWRPLADDLAYEVVSQRLVGLTGWVLDGFPRNISQAARLAEVDVVIYLAVSEEVAIQRVLSRQRDGDSLEKLQARLAAERQRLAPLLEHCRSRWLFIEIDATPSPDVVWHNTLKEVKENASNV